MELTVDMLLEVKKKIESSAYANPISYYVPSYVYDYWVDRGEVWPPDYIRVEAGNLPEYLNKEHNIDIWQYVDG